MSTIDTSEAAYERLRRISAQAELAGSIEYDFVKLKRAIETCNSDLFLQGDADPKAVEMLAQMEIFAIAQRRAYRELMDKLTDKASSLNERIQNGVYNG